INTSIVALLPVAAILFVGVGLLGAGTLKDLALALFVGLLAGTYSSLFVATPFLCQMKETQPQMKSLAQRVLARRAGASANRKGADGAGEVTAGTGGSSGGTGDDGAEAAAVTAAAAVPERKERPHRQAGPRNQPKNTPRSKR
ncbi:MAG TPA: protein translocase subunit SecF, partial [Actinomycetota bacterium]|nr:protein translocase subunit SecF [Actinomycetota bacterium]